MKRFILISILLSTIGTINLYGQNIELEWAKQIVGQSPNAQTLDNIFPTHIEADINNNIIIVGTFEGIVDFDPSPNNFNMTAEGEEDIFILKLDSNGDFIWAKRLGNSASEYCSAISLDHIGNIYLTGHFQSAVDFNPDPTADFILTSTWNVSPPYGYFDDLFVLKLDSDGNFQFASQGGSSNLYGTAISVGISGNIFVAGTTGINGTAFVQKYNSIGGLIWSESNLSGNPSYISSIHADLTDNLFCVGVTGAPASAFIYAAKIENNGTVLPLYINQETSYFGAFQGAPPYIKYAPIVDLDDNDNVFIGYNQPTQGMTGQIDNLTVLKLSKDLDFFFDPIYYWGYVSGSVTPPTQVVITSPIELKFQRLKVGENGNVYISGHGYIAKLNTDGIIQWIEINIQSTPAMSNRPSQPIAIDNNENIYSTGLFYGIIDFDHSTSSVNELENIGYYDGYVLKFHESNPDVSLNNLNFNNHLSIHPNPSSGQFSIQTSNEEPIHSIRITNSIGQVVMQLNNLNQSIVKIELKENAGIYFVEVTSNEEKNTSRIILN